MMGIPILEKTVFILRRGHGSYRHGRAVLEVDENHDGVGRPADDEHGDDDEDGASRPQRLSPLLT